MKPKRVFNDYVEFAFNLVLELIALFDFVGDIYLLIGLFKSEHTGWFGFSLLSMMSPFFICYVPLLTFQKRKIADEKTSFW